MRRCFAVKSIVVVDVVVDIAVVIVVIIIVVIDIFQKRVNKIR